MKISKRLINLVFGALLAALCCVSTMIIQIPTPTGGFVNLGDVVIILAAWLLSPVYAVLSAALGSMLADILAGYAQYAPATFVIKGLMALVAWGVFRISDKIVQKKPKLSFLFTALSALCAEALMVLGYFIFEAFLLHYGMGALASVVPNLMQGLAGILGGTILTELINRTSPKSKLFS